MERPFPAYRGDQPYVFVAYSHEDSAAVFEELSQLRDWGANVYYDEGISPGHEWTQELADALDGAARLLFFVTPKSVRSRNCRNEVQYAIDGRKQVIPVFLEPTELTGGLRLALGAAQAVLKYDLSSTEYRAKLCRALGLPLPNPVAPSAPLPAVTSDRSPPREKAPSSPTGDRSAVAAPTTGLARLRRWLQKATVIGSAVTAFAAAIWILAFERAPPDPQSATASTGGARFQRMTELVGIEEMPAASPDGKMVAYVAPDERGRRQVWIQLLTGGSPLQVTRGNFEAIHPRWLPDSSALVYLAPPETGDAGTLWEVSALGGAPRRLTTTFGGADVSHDGKRIAFFRSRNAEFMLAVHALDGAASESVIELPPGMAYSTPRWSPDDKAIAFVANEGGFSNAIYFVPAGGGEVTVVARARSIRGFTWLQDGSAFVYASSTGSTLIYPPIFQLREVARNGLNDRPLTLGDVSYVDPDIAEAGKVFASQITMKSDVWSFPITGSPVENVAKGVRVTHQTGQVQTPSVSPDGKHVTYLSDTGGHSNIWVTSIGGSTPRQITFERDPDVLIGLPIWSPAGDRIVFVRRSEHGTGEWLVNPDGSALREIVPSGVSAQWSADGRWLLYYTPPDGPHNCIERVPADGGPAERVRCDAGPFAVSSDWRTLYFAPNDRRLNRIFKASPPGAEGALLAEYATERIALWPQGFVISPDDRWLALPLKDGATTDIWMISTVDGHFRQVTDFGRPTLIGRQVSWAADGQSIFAALAEIDSNIVLLDGLTR